MSIDKKNYAYEFLSNGDIQITNVTSTQPEPLVLHRDVDLLLPDSSSNLKRIWDCSKAQFYLSEQQKIIETVQPKFDQEPLVPPQFYRGLRNTGTNSSVKYLELGVFVDQAMWDLYQVKFGEEQGEQALNTFLDAILDTTQLMWKLDSITPKLEFKISMITIWKSQPSALPVTASTTLEQYVTRACAFIQPKASGYDHVTVISGYELKEESGRILGGMAYTSAMCSSQSCSVINAGVSGFRAGFSLTHEIGHSLGMYHDGNLENEETINCSPTCCIMTPYGAGSTFGLGSTASWSSCSRHMYHQHLISMETAGTDCLQFVMATDNPDTMPGQNFTADAQCHSRMAACSRSYPSNLQDCTSLLCTTNNGETVFKINVMKLDGTYCGAGKVCQSGTCAAVSAALPSVDGGWSDWREAEEDCGGGGCSQCSINGQSTVEVEVRTCSNPYAQNEGLPCAGNTIRGKLCIFKSCSGVKTSRSQYESDYCLNETAIVNENMQTSCTFRCERNGVWISRNNLPNGFPCGDLETGMCVNGQCLYPMCGNSQYYVNDAGECPDSIPCTYSAWGQWSSCSETCGVSTKTRSRIAVEGTCTGPLQETTSCVLGSCSCTYSSWSAFTTCSKSCGGGSKTRTRVILIGSSCSEPIEEEHTCNNDICPVDCQYGSWSLWSMCSASCGTGTRIATRVVTKPSAGAGTPCLASQLSKSEVCSAGSCPRNCVYNSWGVWSLCTASCGGGTRTATRTVSQNSLGTGTPCNSADQSKTEACNTDACVNSCLYSNWGAWTSCSSSCGGGTRTATRTVIQEATGSGTPCNDAAKTKTETCGASTCSRDCQYSSWTTWSICSVSCGGGKRTGSRFVLLAPVGNGAPCDPDALNRTGECNTRICPIPCQYSAWGSWTPCSKSCGGGTRSAQRTVLAEPVGFGTPCQTSELTVTEDCNTDSCATNCQYTNWGEWSSCSVSCGGGTRSQTRAILLNPSGGGTPCDADELFQSEQCSGTPCPQNCQYSNWGTWTSCTVSCGGGTRSSSRTVVEEATGGGTPCLSSQLSKSANCNLDVCPRDCQYSNWGSWSSCSISCGGGTRSASRTVELPALGAGKPCTSADQSKSENCNTAVCPKDCQYTTWSSWSSCSATCGGGLKSASRDVAQPSVGTGAPCLASERSRTESCNQDVCPRDCQYSSWADWSLCTVTCGGGTRSASRTVAQPALGTGRACTTADQSKSEPCSTTICPRDCQYTAWSVWSSCSVSCNGGTRIASRSIAQTSVGTGQPCHSSQQSKSESCNTEVCPVNCQYSSWETWSPCSVTCGAGTRTSQRNVAVAAVGAGTPCSSSDLTKSESCQNGVCPTDCSYSSWGSWSTCSKSCNSGTMTMTRLILQQPTGNGEPCDPDSLSYTVTCNTQTCGRDCKYTQWSTWSSCDKTCGLASQTSVRLVSIPGSGNGKPCSAEPLSRSRQCENQPMCRVDCRYTSWTSYSTCTKSCGGGTYMRSRAILTQASGGGTECDATALLDRASCNTQVCITNCRYSLWSSWSSCSKTCGSGVSSRNRMITQQASGGGTGCDSNALIETQTCNTLSCDVDCGYSEWSPWADCSVTCGEGTMATTRTIMTQAQGNGNPCLSSQLSSTQSCNLGACPCEYGTWTQWSSCPVSCGGGLTFRERIQQNSAVNCEIKQSQFQDCASITCVPDKDCQYNSWGNWGSCTVSCGGGTTLRSRTTASEATGQGVPCSINAQSETTDCNTQRCPRDCVYGIWGSWSTCSVSCGGGNTSRQRAIVSQAEGTGTACRPEFTIETVDCNTAVCPVDCVYGTWGFWTPCSASCGGGTTSRQRAIISQAVGTGAACQASAISESTSCNTAVCPVDCIYGSWGLWTPCSASCGGGTTSRQRTIISQAVGTGAACQASAISESTSCNTAVCPMDCIYGTWGFWTTCSATCGGGTTSRQRAILSQAVGTGVACQFSDTSQSTSCNTAVCPVDCVYGTWGSWATCSVTCGGGTTSRQRTIISQAVGTGAACQVSATSQSTSCNTAICDKDCVYGSWSTWTVCSVTCGGGSTNRQRNIVSQAQGNGAVCDTASTVQSDTCNTASCIIDCVYGSWGQWSSCSVTCGAGSKSRFRPIVTEARAGGIECIISQQNDIDSCNLETCLPPDANGCPYKISLGHVWASYKLGSTWKYMGFQTDCASKCNENAGGFECAGYVTNAVEGFGYCYLHSEIINPVLLQNVSTYGLFQSNCAGVNPPELPYCNHYATKFLASPDQSGFDIITQPNNFYTSAEHCQVACMRSKVECIAFAFRLDRVTNQKKCFLYSAIDAAAADTSVETDWTLYEPSCTG